MRVRDVTEADLPFLREMLYAAALWDPEGEHPPIELALDHPQLVIYHKDWGRTGDLGLIAEEDGTPIGCVYYRFFTQSQHGHGYVDDDTPELAIAVVDGHRGKGVGRTLMEAIAQRGRDDGLKQIALSVNDKNPAKRLYAALGYEEYEPGDGHGRMILKL